MPHPPLLAGVATTPLPLAPTGPVPAETKDGDAGAPSAAEREGAAASPPTAARVAHYFASDAYVMGALRVGGALRATGAGGGQQALKRWWWGYGDAGIEGVGAEVSGERAMEASAVEKTVWDRLGEEGGESHDYFEDITQTLSKRGCYVRSQHAHIKAEHVPRSSTIKHTIKQR